MGVVILSNREDTRPTALAASILEEAIGRDFPGPHPAAEARRRRRQRRLHARAAGRDRRGAMSTSTRASGCRSRSRTASCAGRPWATRSPSITRAAACSATRTTTGRRFPPSSGSSSRVRRRHLPAPPRRPGHGAAPARAAVRIHRRRLAAFAGCYESAEIDSRHRVRVHGSGLVVEYGLGGDGGRAFRHEADRARRVSRGADGPGHRLPPRVPLRARTALARWWPRS